MILDQFSLAGKVAVVTGCRRGLGRGMTLGLAEAGADIFGVGTGDMSGIRAEVEARGRKFAFLNADLTTTEPVEAIISGAVEAFGHLDILLNNAGITRRAAAIDMTEQDWDDVMGVNLKTLFFLCQRAAKEYLKQGTGGKIINVASMLSYQGGIRVAPYTASKSGVMGITRLLANEWAPHNINVNAIAPGYMATDMCAGLQADPARAPAILERIPAGRWGTPEDLAGIAVFLASEASSYMHGFTVAVDGGWLAR